MSGKKLTCFKCGQINRVPYDKLGAGPKCGTCGTGLMSGKVAEVDLATFEKAVRNDDVPLVVDFWAPWCGPCRQMAPQYQAAAQDFKGAVRLVKLNTEAHRNAGSKYRIRGIPTMAAFTNGKERARQSGALPKTAIVKWIKASV
ncbi:thioredoxin TrxC [Shimia sp. R11_0]|uniref:Thioredoxin n=1 Tax=Shimia marina TaxID=321267 RepID=A0A0P1EV14_9RHOB|nr:MULTISPECIES: thioredoxin TrxC [Shimia]MBO9478225.1 thioredoxin TrxC [Shimia sp. R11_0]CUH54406.1 Thioredoxin-2 [Shimia marina]SFE02902.1 thioredoxin [Shimia marina]